jgi:hypothetical protein
MGVVQHLPICGVQCLLDSAEDLGMCVVIQHNDSCNEHAGVLSRDCGMKVLKYSAVALCTDGVLGSPAHEPWGYNAAI